MAAEKKAAKLTEYTVLRLVARDSEECPSTWGIVNSVLVASATTAIRAVVASLEPAKQAGTFVAVPNRSWQPVTVNPQTTIRLELTEAKP